MSSESTSSEDEAAEEVLRTVPFARPSALAEGLGVLGAQLAVFTWVGLDPSPLSAVIGAGAALMAGVSWFVARTLRKPERRHIERVGDNIVIREQGRLPVSRISAIDLRRNRFPMIDRARSFRSTACWALGGSNPSSAHGQCYVCVGSMRTTV